MIPIKLSTMRFVKSLVLCLLLVTGAHDYAVAQARSLTYVTYSGSQPMGVYIPPGPVPEGGWPWCVFLHGQGPRGNNISQVEAEDAWPKLIKAGQDFPMVVLYPQLGSGFNTWTPAIVHQARTWGLNNLDVNPFKYGTSGISLGGIGADEYARTYASLHAWVWPMSGSYAASTAQYDSLAKVPHYMVSGFADAGVGNPNNAWGLMDQLYARNPAVLPEGEFPWGMGHSGWSTIYANRKYYGWTGMHDLRPDSTAKYYVDSVDRAINKRDMGRMYYKALHYINTAAVNSTHKTALLSRLSSIMDTKLYGVGHKRAMIKLTVNGAAPIAGVNIATEGNTGSTYPNLLDQNGVNTGWGFNVVTRPIPGGEEVSYGIAAPLFGGWPASVFKNAWDIYNRPNNGKWRITGLTPNKPHIVQLFGEPTGIPFTLSYRGGLIGALGGVSDTITEQVKNTTKWMEWTFTPSSSTVDIDLQSFVQYGHGFANGVVVIELGTFSSGGNILPTASAGGDLIIRLPTNSVSLNGSGSSDGDGTIASYAWTKVSGGAATIVSPSSVSTSITGLVAGTYVFRLTVTDNGGGQSTDDVQVTVDPAFHSGPIISTEADKTITSSVTSLNSTITANTIAKILWQKTRVPGFTSNIRILCVGSSTFAGNGLAATTDYVTYKMARWLKASGAIDTMYYAGNNGLVSSGTDIFGVHVIKAITFCQANNCQYVVANFPSNTYGSGSPTYSEGQIAGRWKQWDDSLALYGITLIPFGTHQRDSYSPSDRAKLGRINDTMKAPAVFGDRMIDVWSISNNPEDNTMKLQWRQTPHDLIHYNADYQTEIARKAIPVILKALSNRITSPSNIVNATQQNASVSGLTVGTHSFQVSVIDTAGYANNDTIKVTVSSVGCSGRRINWTPGWYKDMATALPGDTFVIAAGSYPFTEIVNCMGTAQCPIVFINSGGQAVFEAFNINFPSQHVKILGTGHPGTAFGFKMANSNYWGMHIKCEGPVEVSNVEITNVQMGVQYKYGDTYPDALTQHTDFKFHNSWIHDIPGNEGIYINSSTTPKYPKSKGVHIYDVLIENTGREGLQISNSQNVLVERVKIFNPSIKNEGSQNHAFNAGHDVQGVFRQMYIQSSPADNVFFSGGRITFECSTIEHIPRIDIPRAKALWGKNYEFNAQDWDETFQQFTIKNILLKNAGGVSFDSELSYGPLQANQISHIKIESGATTPMKWSTGNPVANVVDVGPAAVFSDGCAPPNENTMWTVNWPATSPTANIPPSVTLPANISIILPTNLVTIAPFAVNDPDGAVTTYAWSKISGGSATIATPTAATTIITGLSVGTYVFRLTVTDNSGATASDDITVVVKATDRVQKKPKKTIFEN